MAIARRDFLKVVGGASFVGSVGSVALPAVASGVSVPEFGFSDDSVPMNAANLCPMPLEVTAAEAKYARELDRDLSPATRSRIEALKEDARARIAALLGASADELAIVRNTSEANNVIVQGIPLDAGDEIVLWDQNHPSNSVAWDVRAARSGCSVRRFSVPTEAGSIDEVVDIFLQSLSDKTRVVSFTHISNITGFRTPVAEICAAIRKRKDDIHIHVDGAQTWGAIAFDLGKVDCDSFSGSAHKWFMGPREVGLLFVRERHIGRIWPIVVSVPWGADANAAPKGARKFDALGQRDDASIASLGDAATLHETLTPAGVEGQSAAVAGRLRAGLLDLGLPFVSSVNPPFTSSVIILKAARDNAGRLVTDVLKDSGIITAAVGGFRMSPHVYNNADHVDRVIAAAGRLRALFG
ncbi:MAG TPA: aminotransferase class V-fold PLP-dependent enzyme [Woeseiaceae bacterium]|nr:aminotransferase class V-fold PLP-dependent enzyme [Woeseiaceae bacterium]